MLYFVLWYYFHFNISFRNKRIMANSASWWVPAYPLYTTQTYNMTTPHHGTSKTIFRAWPLTFINYERWIIAMLVLFFLFIFTPSRDIFSRSHRCVCWRWLEATDFLFCFNSDTRCLNETENSVDNRERRTQTLHSCWIDDNCLIYRDCAVKGWILGRETNLHFVRGWELGFGFRSHEIDRFNEA